MDAPDTNAPDTTERWVEDRLRALDPPDTWEPSAAVGLAHFRERAAATGSRRASRWYPSPQPSPRERGEGGRSGAWGWIAAASAACLILLLTPATRATAQRLWDVFFAERVEFVTLDVDKLPRSLTEQNIRMNGAHTEVASIEAAAGYVGFTPRLPDGTVAAAANGRPRVQVASAISVESRISVPELDAAARQARLFDVHFPRAWDGARVAVHSSPMVIADYPSFQLVQVMPLAITTPPDFDLAAFTERIMRIGGMELSDAQTFAAQMETAPFALFAISPKDEVTMRQVRLGTGEGTLVHDFNDAGAQRTTLVWSTVDRLYVISSSLPDDEVIAIANAIPRE